MAIIFVFDGKRACIGWEGQNPFPTGEKSAESLEGQIDCRVARCNPAEAAVWRVERKTEPVRSSLATRSSLRRWAHWGEKRCLCLQSCFFVSPLQHLKKRKTERLLNFFKWSLSMLNQFFLLSSTKM
jgi:hypothetical protein